MSYGVSLYYINGDNLIMSNGLFPPLNINSGEIENWGVETNIGYHINSHWNVNANYSWLHMENPVLAAPEHKLYAGADYNFRTLEYIDWSTICERTLYFCCKG